MQIFVRAAELQEYLGEQKKLGKTIGFVPTMGALHEGHLSLVKASRSETDLTVGSLFVNPTQFNNPEDFRLYPTQPEKDRALLSAAGCDVLFMPETKEIYPEGTKVLHSYPLGYLETIMEGKFRPGHFQGVCQVVDRLLNIVNPDILFLGQKDWQQCKVIEKLLALTGRSETIKLVICPTMRELNGLAMSSRNQRLHEDDRKKASLLYNVMIELKKVFGKTSFYQERKSMIQHLENNGFTVEYLELVDSNTLEILHEWDDKRTISVCIAAYLSNVRLIDNMILHTVH
jgi:pantoate--beta-alanine ligase